MTTVDRLLAYEAWANQRILGAVRALPPEAAERARTVFAHVANGSKVWYQRVTGAEVTAAPWDDLSIDQCAQELEQLQELWSRLLHGENDLGRVISYRTMDGVPFRTPLRDILQHLSFHSHYHRGQVNAAIRAAGGTPVNVDFILFQREGH